MLPEIVEASRQHARTSRRTPEANPFQIPWFPKAALPPKKYQMAMDNDAGLRRRGDVVARRRDLEQRGVGGAALPGLHVPLAARAATRLPQHGGDDRRRRDAEVDQVRGHRRRGGEEKRQAQDFADPDGSQERRETRLKEKGKTDKVKALNDYMQKLALQKIFFDLCRDDGFFGRTTST
jgi:hypothetical protein